VVQRGRLGAFPFRDLPFAAIDDPNYVMIDLEFDSHDAADAMRRVLEALWGARATGRSYRRTAGPHR
jgi:hypothetical protein